MTNDAKAKAKACAEAFRPLAEFRVKIDPISHGVRMYRSYVNDGYSGEVAAENAIRIALEEYRGRIQEMIDMYNFKVDPATGLLR